MPREPRGDEILAAIREYLKEAVKGKVRITDGRLMKAAVCSRATFYKYVTPDSQIRLDIDEAKKQQKKRPKPGGEEPEDAPRVIIKALRKEVEELKEALRMGAAFKAKFISNLSEGGVRPDVIQKAQTDAMSHPNRKYPRRGRSRGRKNQARQTWHT